MDFIQNYYLFFKWFGNPSFLRTVFQYRPPSSSPSQCCPILFLNAFRNVLTSSRSVHCFFEYPKFRICCKKIRDGRYKCSIPALWRYLESVTAESSLSTCRIFEILIKLTNSAQVLTYVYNIMPMGLSLVSFTPFWWSLYR